MNDKIKHLRQEYSLATLTEDKIQADPVTQFQKWFEDALQAELPEPHAMTVSTVSQSSRPSSRIVLLRNFDADGFLFYTNYKSKKSGEGEQNPFVALNFFWQQIERQVRIEGKMEKITAQESDDYFASRPRESQIGAWASAQSQVISSRTELEEQVKIVTEKFENSEIPRPPHWGGLRVIPDYFEFWQGRPGRLHDRITYRMENGVWQISRLNP